MTNSVKFEPVLSNFLDESFSNGNGDKSKKQRKPKKQKQPKQKKVKNKTNDSGDDGSVDKKIDADKIQKGVEVAGQVISQIPKNQAKQELKAACGRKRIFGKAKRAYNECVNEYYKQKNKPKENIETKVQPIETKEPEQIEQQQEEKKFYENPLFLIGVSAVVVFGGIFVYTKFIKKNPSIVPVTN